MNTAHHGGRSEPSVLAPIASRRGDTDPIVSVARRPLTASGVARMLTALGGPVHDDDQLVLLLQQVVKIAHDAIDGTDSCGVTITLGGTTYTAVHTDARTLEVDSHQYRAGEGPCLEAARTGRIVRVDVDDADNAWPVFAQLARADGVHSFLAAPLRSSELELGSLNLYGIARNAFGEVDESVLSALTTVVARALGDYSRVRSSEEVARGLREAIRNRAPIEQAKGMLMALRGIDEDQAFEVLSRESQRTNRKLRDVAREFVQNVSGTNRSTGA